MQITPFSNDLHAKLPDSTTKIKTAATQFEAMMIQQMLKSAHAAGGSAWSGDEEDPNSTLTEMGEQQLAQSLASNGGVGLAKMVVAGLSKNADQSSESPQSSSTSGAH